MSNIKSSGENVDSVIKELSDREKRIIGERLGLGAKKAKTRSEVSKMFAVSEERIQQLEEKVKKLLTK